MLFLALEVVVGLACCELIGVVLLLLLVVVAGAIREIGQFDDLGFRRVEETEIERDRGKCVCLNGL